MSYVKTIVCLANSRKHAGRCIAGKEMLPDGFGGWVRPVSGRTTTELGRNERRYDDGKDPKIGDVMQVSLLEPAPHLYQRENQLVDAAQPYRRLSRLPWDLVSPMLDHPETLWVDGSSSRYGVNDRVHVDEAATLEWSLALIAPEGLTMRVRSESGKPRLRAHFWYRGQEHLFSVTDPFTEWEYLAKPDGEYPVADAALSVSLGEPYTDGYCYKLVATVVAKSTWCTP